MNWGLHIIQFYHPSQTQGFQSFPDQFRDGMSDGTFPEAVKGTENVKSSDPP